MLDESEFKPFTLNDFSAADTAPENTDSTSNIEEKLGIASESTDTELSDRIESFKPITFQEQEVSKDFISNNSNSFQETKTNAEKIQLSEEFKNSEFFLENSLLTNAEEFAERIREGAKLHKAELLKQIEEQANDTDRIHQKTVAENQAAEQHRNLLLSETENKVQQIKDEAFKEGFEEGRVQGMQQRYDEAEPLAKQANKILEQLDSLRKVIRFQAEEELVKLALIISKNIVAEEIKLNQDVIKNIVRAALHETEVKGKIYLYLHPDDYEFLLKSKTELESFLSDEQNLIIRKNTDMQLGSINVVSDEEIISRSILEQFNLIEDNLNKQMEIQQAHLNEVDIDAHDFKLKPDQGNDTTIKESPNSQNLEILDESLNLEQSEQETSQDDFVEKGDTNDNVNKKDPVLGDEVSNPVELSLKDIDTKANPIEKTPSEKNSTLDETSTREQKHESTLPTNTGINTEAEEIEETSSDSLEEKPYS